MHLFSLATTLLLFTPSCAGEQKFLAKQLDPSFQSSKGVSNALFASLERLARLVDIAYCVGTTGLSSPFSCVSRCRDFPFLELETTWHTGILMSDSCGYIALDHGSSDDGPAIIVAFRGTYSLTNTIVDLSTVPQEYVPYPEPDDGKHNGDKPECHDCTVHMGFWESWNNARTLVLPVLVALHERFPHYRLQLIGHSLGGAVAALAALELKVSLGWDDVVVTTFGEPRVGNDGLARFIDQVFHLDDSSGQSEAWTYRRLTHINDPVPLLPLTEWGFRSHAGEIYISKYDLPPLPENLHICHGDNDQNCTAGEDTVYLALKELPNDIGSEDLWSQYVRDDRTLARDLVLLNSRFNKTLDRLRELEKLCEGKIDLETWTYREWFAAVTEPIKTWKCLQEWNNAKRNVDSEILWRKQIVMETKSFEMKYADLVEAEGFPVRLKLWQFLFAHRDYFWRLGLCVPGGDPSGWRDSEL